MYCKNCGTENKGQANFCEKCGIPLEMQGEMNRAGMEKQAVENQPEPNHDANQNRKKRMVLTAVVLAVIVVCIIGVVLYTNSKNQAGYNGKLQTADKYLAAMEYEKAEAAYLEAIKIQPKKEEAYINLADVYTRQGNYDKAIDTLKKGEVKAGGKKIDTKLKETQKVAKRGTVNAQFSAYYELCTEYRKEYGNPDFITNDEKYGPSEYDEYSESTDGLGDLQGLCVTKLYDFDQDGNQELLLAYQKAQEDEFGGVQDTFQYEIWAWQDNKLVNVLPATKANTGQDVTTWIETVIKDGIPYLSIDRLAWDGPAQYMQYEGGKFKTEYEYETQWPEDGTEEVTYLINGKTVSAKAFEEALPASKAYEQIETRPYDPGSRELLIQFRSLTAGYAQAVMREAESTMELLETASAANSAGTQRRTWQSLCAEYQKKYGKPGYTKWEGSDYYDLTGLCVVRLIDFDKDGSRELLLGYEDKNAMGGYAYEVWAQQDSAIQVLKKTIPPHSNGDSMWIETAEKEGTVYLWGFEDGDNGEKEEYLCLKDGKFTPEYTIESEYGSDEVIINGKKTKVEEWNRLSEAFGWYASAENHYLKKDGKLSIPMAYMEKADKDAVLEDTNRALKSLKTTGK